MVGIDTRAARATWTVFLVALALFLAFVIRKTLLIFTAALLFAYLLTPLVELVGRLFHRERSRNISLAVVYLALLGILITAGSFIGAEAIDQAAHLTARLPELVEWLSQPVGLPLPEWLQSRRQELVTVIREQIEQHAKDLLPILRRAGVGLLALLGNLPFFVLVPVLSFLFLKDGASFRQDFLDRIVGNSHRLLIEDILSDVHLLLLQFMRAIVILCVLTFVFYAVFFVVTDVPYPILLATIAGLLEFIPFVGPLTAGVLIFLVAAFSGYDHLLWIVIFLLSYRMFQDYVIQPYLMSAGIALHPLAVIFGVMAGQQIGGIPGMFLSIPVLATLRVVMIRLWKQQAAPFPDATVR